ncbi:uncharacterized protein [Lolium perenne]|uniref:uncharacterized protein n=1 Tax=Lolium perenne TaxID=4522 RepID=UPI003A99256E
MERAWHQANSCEVLSREGQPGTAPMKMLFSGYRASLKTKAAETLAQLATLEDAEKTVEERRTVLYNQVVTSYHRAKIERAALARELEAVKAEAAKVPQLESDLRAARAQCAESEEAGRSAAGKLKLAEQELTRLRLLEKNHIAELNSLRSAEKEKVDDLSRRLSEVEKQRLALQEEVTVKSTELTATAKRWTDDFSALDRGLAAAFPETQEAALAAVGVARDSRRRETGEGSSEYFSMEDHLASMAARIEPVKDWLTECFGLNPEVHTVGVHALWTKSLSNILWYLRPVDDTSKWVSCLKGSDRRGTNPVALVLPVAKEVAPPEGGYGGGGGYELGHSSQAPGGGGGYESGQSSQAPGGGGGYEPGQSSHVEDVYGGQGDGYVGEDGEVDGDEENGYMPNQM